MEPLRDSDRWCPAAKPSSGWLIVNLRRFLAKTGIVSSHWLSRASLTFDLACAAQVFARAPDLIDRAGQYDFVSCGVERFVPSADGFALTLNAGLDAIAGADTVIVPGYASFAVPPPMAAVSALTAAAARGARVMSTCMGAFALAHAGLLDGRRATTHWMATGLLAEAFPRVEVVPDVLYVDDGDILTSAGLAAGLDLCLHVVRRDQGAEAAAHDRSLQRGRPTPRRRPGAVHLAAGCRSSRSGPRRDAAGPLTT